MGSRGVLDLYKVKVPGSLMLFGEHAVLHHKQAVVAAINHHIEITLIPRADNKIEIISSLLKSHLVALTKFTVTKPYDYVLTAIKQFLPKITCGFTLKIEANFPSTIGFGSSAAVTVATLAVLHWWLFRKKPEQKQLYRQAILVVHLVQGCGSGADVAASVFGGVIAYKIAPLEIKKIGDTMPLVAIYSGSKVATPKVIAIVENMRRRLPHIVASIYAAIDCCAKEAISAIKNNNWLCLGKIMDIHQGLHDALGVNNATLSKLVFSLRSNPHIYGAKISGSGLGDCVIGLGKIARQKRLKNQVDVAISSSGITYL